MRYTIFAIGFFIGLAIMPAQAASLVSGRLGVINYTAPAAKPSNLVILFPDPAKPDQTKAAISALNAVGAAVAIIPPDAYLKTLQADKADCVYLASDIEILSHSIQRQLGFTNYGLPLLASFGPGGALVYVLMAEAPNYSFGGAVSVDFTTQAPQKLKFCGGPDITGKGRFDTQGVNQTWLVSPVAAESDTVKEWVDDVDKASFLDPAAKKRSIDTLVAALQPMIVAKHDDPETLQDLPLIELPASKPEAYVAIIYSGDGGWRDLDRTLGQLLSDNGVPVIGIDSLLYFWQEKRPELIAHDLDRIIDHYRTAWKINKFVLIGFSFGADILPFAYNHLTPENKAAVIQTSLLGLSRNTGFEISLDQYLSSEATDQMKPIASELAKMPASRVQCFYGEEETAESGCTLPAAQKMEIIKTTGGHHFGEDYDALEKHIVDGAKKRLDGKKS